MFEHSEEKRADITIDTRKLKKHLENEKQRAYEEGRKDQRFDTALAIIRLLDEHGVNRQDDYVKGLVQVMAAMFEGDNQ